MIENNEIDIYCDMQKSKLNTERYLCKHCGQTISEEEFNSNSIPMCYNKLEMAALREDIPQVKLKSIKFIDAGGNEIKKEITKPPAISHDWWNYNTNQAVKQTQKKPEEQKPYIAATTEKISERMNVCESCEFFKENVCLKCGCSLSREKNYKNKLYNADAKCPIGKW